MQELLSIEKESLVCRFSKTESDEEWKTSADIGRDGGSLSVFAAVEEGDEWLQ